MNRKILVGLSGGVDSALTAAVLQQDGFDVSGLYCMMHDADASGLFDAQKIADQLNIPLYTADLREPFDRIVVTDFLDHYAQAKTPNPCIVCNPAVKFKALIDKADEIGADRIATGHYASVGWEQGRYFIRAVEDKDQSYMLYRLTQDQLARIVFPLANTKKETNRELAKNLNLSVSHKPDSQDICFIKGESYVEYIQRRRGIFPEGEFWLEDENRVVGTHKGLIRYTVGQRKNLGIALGTPVYVTRLEAEQNRVVLSRKDVINCTEITVNSPVFQRLSPKATRFKAEAKIRFSAKTAPCTVTVRGGKLYAQFDTPQRASTPGQSAVFYRNGTILCGGFIE